MGDALDGAVETEDALVGAAATGGLDGRAPRLRPSLLSRRRHREARASILARRCAGEDVLESLSVGKAASARQRAVQDTPESSGKGKVGPSS